MGEHKMDIERRRPENTKKKRSRLSTVAGTTLPLPLLRNIEDLFFTDDVCFDYASLVVIIIIQVMYVTDFPWKVVLNATSFLISNVEYGGDLRSQLLNHILEELVIGPYGPPPYVTFLPSLDCSDELTIDCLQDSFTIIINPVNVNDHGT